MIAVLNNSCPIVTTEIYIYLHSKPSYHLSFFCLEKSQFRGGTLGNFLIFSFKLSGFKAILSCFLLHPFSLKIGTFHLLSGQLGQGLKIGIVPGKSGHLAGLQSPPPSCGKNTHHICTNQDPPPTLQSPSKSRYINNQGLLTTHVEEDGPSDSGSLKTFCRV